VASVVVDDHLLRDVLTGARPPDLGGIAEQGIATTGLWLFRLCSSLADPTVVGKLSSPVAVSPAEAQERFRAQLTALPDEIEVLPLSELSWSMAELQPRHRAEGRSLSVAPGRRNRFPQVGILKPPQGLVKEAWPAYERSEWSWGPVGREVRYLWSSDFSVHFHQR